MNSILNFWRNALPVQKALSVLTIAAFVLTPFTHGTVFAQQASFTSVDITDISPMVDGCLIAGTEVTVSGTATAEAPPGQLQQYHVQIDWGDGNTDDETESGSFGTGHGTSTRNFGSTHTYTATGTLTITARIYHQTTPGNDGQADAVESAEVCVIEDSEPTTGSITIEKTVTGTSTPTTWSFDLGGITGLSTLTDSSSSFSTTSIATGNYTVSEGALPDSNWSYGGVECTGDATITEDDVNNSVDIDLGDGESTTCTFTNVYEEITGPTFGDIVVIKTVTNDDQTGTSTVSDFELSVGTTTVTSGATTTVATGNYVVSETGPAGYTATFGGACDADGNVTVVEGQTVTCTITNDDIPEDVVDYCDPSQKPGGMSLAEWFEENDVDASTCFDYEVVQQCGAFDVQFTRNDTPYDYEFRYVLGTTTPDLAGWEGDGVLPVNFAEDENSGSVEVTYYVVGPESDYFTGFGIPNIWDGNGSTVVVDTDCEGDGGNQCEIVDLQIVSDSDTQVDGGNATSTFEHANWTADDVLTLGSWIWSSFNVVDPATTTTKVFTRTFNWTGDTSVVGSIDVATDNTHEVRVNGVLVGSSVDGDNFTSSTYDNYDVSSALVDGSNTLEITVTNLAANTDDPEANPAGLLYELDLEGENCETPTPPDEPTGDDDDDDSSTSGGGGGIINRNGGGDDDDNDDDGEVAGESVVIEIDEGEPETDETQPIVRGATIGLPATGAGGAAGSASSALPLAIVAMIGVLSIVRMKLAVAR